MNIHTCTENNNGCRTITETATESTVSASSFAFALAAADVMDSIVTNGAMNLLSAATSESGIAMWTTRPTSGAGAGMGAGMSVWGTGGRGAEKGQNAS